MKIPARVKIPVGRAELSLRPMMWMFLAILVTFLITRIVTRLIRSGSGAGAGLGNVRIAGQHVHHQVFGILTIIGTGIVLVSAMPRGAALDAAAAVFGVGVGLTVDEFALWLHLEDVYWADQGRKSVDAIFCVLVITGTLIGGADFVTGRVGTVAWWSSVAVIAVNLLLCVICLLKGKVVTGITGVFISVAALIGAIRLAKPGSWWAAHRYATGRGSPAAPQAATTSVASSAGTGCGISSPAPPPSKARLTASTAKREACSPPDRTPAMAPRYLLLYARAGDAKHPALPQITGGYGS